MLNLREHHLASNPF